MGKKERVGRELELIGAVADLVAMQTPTRVLRDVLPARLRVRNKVDVWALSSLIDSHLFGNSLTTLNRREKDDTESGKGKKRFAPNIWKTAKTFGLDGDPVGGSFSQKSSKWFLSAERRLLTEYPGTAVLGPNGPLLFTRLSPTETATIEVLPALDSNPGGYARVARIKDDGWQPIACHALVSGSVPFYPSWSGQFRGAVADLRTGILGTAALLMPFSCVFMDPVHACHNLGSPRLRAGDAGSTGDVSSVALSRLATAAVGAASGLVSAIVMRESAGDLMAAFKPARDMVAGVAESEGIRPEKISSALFDDLRSRFLASTGYLIGAFQEV